MFVFVFEVEELELELELELEVGLESKWWIVGVAKLRDAMAGSRHAPPWMKMSQWPGMFVGFIGGVVVVVEVEGSQTSRV